jgi:putative transposase
MRRGFVYLAAVMDWATRRVLAFRLSNTLTRTSASRLWMKRAAATACRRILNTD